MQSETVSFKVHPLEDQEEVTAIEITQFEKNNATARFTLAVNLEAGYKLPSYCRVGTTVGIEAGYDNQMRMLFYGAISNVALTQNGAGFAYIISCAQDNKKALKKGDNTFRPVLGINVLEVDLSSNGKETTGFVRVQGTSDIWCGDNADYSGIDDIFNKAVVSCVKHTIENGNWYTSIYAGTTTATDNNIVLQTANGNSITLDDNTNSIVLKDANGNGVSLTREGIKVTARNQFTAEAEAINQNAQGDIVLKGSKIHLN